jgi:hypothetical protein
VLMGVFPYRQYPRRRRSGRCCRALWRVSAEDRAGEACCCDEEDELEPRERMGGRWRSS